MSRTRWGISRSDLEVTDDEDADSNPVLAGEQRFRAQSLGFVKYDEALEAGVFIFPDLPTTVTQSDSASTRDVAGDA